jgi:DNA-binding XRE family transcriptional regulator
MSINIKRRVQGYAFRQERTKALSSVWYCRGILRAWREHLRLTQADVAKGLGVSQSAYAQMERRKTGLRHTSC